MAECYQYVKRAGCVNAVISETLMREYQVLPMRTHPTMTTSSCSGFVLTCVRACVYVCVGVWSLMM